MGNITINSDNAYLPASIRKDLNDAGLKSFGMGSTNAGIPAAGSDNTRSVTRFVVGSNGSFGAFDQDWKWDTYYQKGIEAGPAQAEAFLAIRNLLDRDPVLVGNGPDGNNIPAYAQTNRILYDVMGRSFRLGVRVSF